MPWDGRKWIEPERTVFIGMMPGGSHYYVADSEETSTLPSTKFDSFQEAFDEALRRVPRDKITVRDAKIKREIIGD